MTDTPQTPPPPPPQQAALQTAIGIASVIGPDPLALVKQPVYDIGRALIEDIAAHRLLVSGEVAQRIAALYARCAIAESQLAQIMSQAQAMAQAAAKPHEGGGSSVEVAS